MFIFANAVVTGKITVSTEGQVLLIFRNHIKILEINKAIIKFLEAIKKLLFQILLDEIN